MITLTRVQVRRLRAVFRRSTLGINHRGVVSELVFRVEGGHLRAQHRYCDLAVEHAEPAAGRPSAIVAVPLDALADFEGAADTPVTLESPAPDRTVVRWGDRGIPQSKEYHLVTPVDRPEPMPAPPASWSSAPPDLLAALAEATETGTDDSSRYALDCLQLQGRGQVVATDGRQLLVRSGFAFPWSEDLLIKARPVFACRSLPRERPVEVGRTDTHVFFRAGQWTISCVIQREARFPAVDRVIPEANEVATRLRLDPEDAGFLEAALGRLPGAGDINAPVTLDLNGHVAVRATSADQPGRVTELVLRRSGYSGEALSVCTNRAMLERALRLGFRELGFTGVETPIVCRDGGRVYAVQPLSGGSPPPADAEVVRIESIAAGADERRVPAARETRETAGPAVVPDRAQASVEESRRPSLRTTADATPTTASDQPTSLAALLQEAEALHATLAEMKSRSARLIAGLRRQRKQSKLVNETLKSLRQLRLVESAG